MKNGSFSRASCNRLCVRRCPAAAAPCRFPHGITPGSMMEGVLPAVPRLACDFYKFYCWASDPPLEGVAQAYSNAEINLRPKKASDPRKDGQAHKDADLSSNEASATTASDPHKEQEGQATITAVNNDLRGASDRAKASRHASLQGKQAVNFTLEFMEALCGMHIYATQDITLLQGSLRQLADQESSEGHSAPLLKHAASPSLPSSRAAHPKASSTALCFSSSTIPAICVHLATTTSTTMPAIPVLLPQLNNSRLRAQASPWKPAVPTLPSILVGDIPLSPMPPSLLIGDIPLSLATTPTPKSTYPSTNAPPLAVGFKPSCKVCGHHPHVSCGPSSSMTFPSSRLRGSNVADQAQESKAAVHHHGTDPARRSTRPRCKMKSELKGFRIQKATLDPG